MGKLPRILLVALVAFCAALAASFLARSFGPEAAPAGGELHDLMHEELVLDAAQERQIAELEARFIQRRQQLDEAMRQANARLAEAVKSEHEYGPRVSEAVDHSHMAMGELQKATLSHVFAMRAVLRPDQAAVFDERIAATLTSSPDQ
jgi:Spy/CpxP family protein refolding chaperone